MVVASAVGAQAPLALCAQQPAPLWADAATVMKMATKAIRILFMEVECKLLLCCMRASALIHLRVRRVPGRIQQRVRQCNGQRCEGSLVRVEEDHQAHRFHRLRNGTGATAHEGNAGLGRSGLLARWRVLLHRRRTRPAARASAGGLNGAHLATSARIACQRRTGDQHGSNEQQSDNGLHARCKVCRSGGIRSNCGACTAADRRSPQAS